MLFEFINKISFRLERIEEKVERQNQNLPRLLKNRETKDMYLMLINFPGLRERSEKLGGVWIDKKLFLLKKTWKTLLASFKNF